MPHANRNHAKDYGPGLFGKTSEIGYTRQPSLGAKLGSDCVFVCVCVYVRWGGGYLSFSFKKSINKKEKKKNLEQ